MESDKLINIYITDSIAIGKHKFISLDEVFYSSNSTSSHGILSGIHKRHLPIISMGIVHCHIIALDVDGDIVVVKKIIGEPLLDHISLVSETDNEFIVSIMCIMFHDMPNDGFSSDFHHRFGFNYRLF